MKTNILKAICTFCLLLSVARVSAQVPQSERDALIALYNATDGPNWYSSYNWFNEDVGTWLGVTVDNGHVTAIDLSRNNLNGPIPPEIGNFPNLYSLRLYDNSINGSIPPEIGNLSNLLYLRLYKNQLTGSIPTEIGNLDKLWYLELNSNQLSGGIPPELGNLINLIEFNLTYNSLNNSIPGELGNMVNLQDLLLNNNNISGSIPYQIGNLSLLQELCLNDNNITGNIPSEFGNLTSLEELYLYNNSLSGSIPAEIGNMTNLNSLLLYNNSLTGNIPPQLGNLTNLSRLSLKNNLLCGNIPSEFGNLVQIETMYLSDNSLSGSIPPELGNLSQLTTLWLDNNQLSGNVPPQLGNLTNATWLNLSNNLLTGAIPSEFGNLSNIYIIDIYNNQLTDLPDLSHLEYIELNVEYNYFTFEDLAPNFHISDHYEHQKPIPVDDNYIQIAASGALQLTISVGGDYDNYYVWYKDGSSIPSSSDSIFEIEVIDFSDAGTYICYARSHEVPGLCLESEEIIVEVLPCILPQDEYDALTLFYDQTDGDNWSNNTNWITGDPTTWYGVEIVNEHVTRIELPYNNLNGQLPAEIGDLNYLERVRLDNNRLNGDIPASFANLDNLILCDISDNDLTGAWPSGLDNLINLYIQNNDLSGLPDLSSSQIQGLEAYGNYFTFEDIEPNTTIPYFNYSPQMSPPGGMNTIYHCLGEPITLTVDVGGNYNQYQWFHYGSPISPVSASPDLYFEQITSENEAGYYCKVTNTLVSDLTINPPGTYIDVIVPQKEYDALVALYNSTDGDNWDYVENWLQGDPDTWWGITIRNNHVEEIHLSGHNLNGYLPPEIGDLTYLKEIFLGGNQIIGEVPPEIGSLTNLEYLSLHTNQISGIPPEIGRLSQLRYFSLDLNQLSRIPPEIGDLSNLKELYITSNQFTSQIPAVIGNLSNLEVLNLSSNQFSGVIPDELYNLTKLKTLNLSRNQLSGILSPHIENLNALNSFYCTANDLSGEIPIEIGELSNLERLGLSRNNFSGSIPGEIGNCSSLQYVYIDENQISGGIPKEIGSLIQLKYLDLRSNELSGELPSEFGNLTNLVSLDLAHNNLSGSIPDVFGNLTQLASLELQCNLFSGTVPPSLGSCIAMKTLNLAVNNLSGHIPRGLSNLSMLEYLDLGGNQLEGIIPEGIGNLHNLKSISLALNNLTGAVPQQFSNLSSLRYLFIKRNRLSDLPDLSSLSTCEIHAFSNCFTFEDLEPNISILFSCAPQARVEVEYEHIAAMPGQSVELSIEVGGDNNLYQWFKDGVAITPIQSGNTHEISNFSQTDVGEYTCEITNTIVTSLTLISNPIQVEEAYNGVIHSEYDALVEFYNAFDGPNWTNNTNWLTGNVDNWFGVTTDKGHVTELQLTNNNLNGSIPALIQDLPELKHIALNGNLISGGIPPEIDALSNLESLNLSNNQLNGTIPYNIGDLNNLSTLQLGTNSLSGTIPGEIGNLVLLEILDLHDNNLSGQLPEEIENLLNLTELQLQLNNFEGELYVDFGELIQLQTLYLNNNQISGSLSQGISGLQNLAVLHIQDNQFTQIPDLSALSLNLIELYTENNNLTFEGLEPNISVLDTYSPQAKIHASPNNINKEIGEPLTLTITTGGSNNQYQWFKDGTAVSTVSTNPEFTIASTIKDDSGIYTCQVTNTVVTGLTLTTEDIEVLIHDPLITQTIPLSANWNIFSTYVEPLDNSCSAVIGDAGLTSSMSIVKNEAGAAYFPSLDFGGFTTFDVGEGYQAKMVSGEDFEITGVSIDPEDVTLTLQSGWNMLGYLRQSAGALTDMLDPVLGSIEIIKDESGLAYYPSLGFGLLNTLEPGKGYMVKMVSQASFSYPSNSAKSGITKPNYVEEPQYFGSPKNTGFNMTLIIPENAWDVLPEHGDELAVFAPDGRLVGSAVLKNAHNMLPVFGDDLTSETKDGLSDGEAFTLQLWHKSSGEIQTLEITNWQDWIPGKQIYQHNGIAVVGQIKTGSSVTGIDAENTNMHISLYPNPVKDELKIHFNTKRHSNCSISIYNSIGQCVKDISGISSAQQTVSVDTQALKAGVYVVRVQSTEGTENITFIKSGN